MAEIEALAIERITEGQSSDDGRVLLLKVNLAPCQELSIAFPRDQLRALVDMAALGRAQSDKILNLPTTRKEPIPVTWWELSKVPQTGQTILSLTTGIGGKLDFLLEPAMLEAMLETLQVHWSASSQVKPDKPPN